MSQSHTASSHAPRPLQHLDERELVQALLRNEADSFDELHHRYARRIHGYCRARLADSREAEDLTQEVFLQIHRSLPRYEGRSPLIGWILGIALNQLRRRWRRPRRSLPLEESDALALPDDGPGPDRLADASRCLERVDALLAARVTAHHRRVFALRYGRGLPTGEIARRIGKSDQAVKMSLHRTRRLLRAEVASAALA